MLPIVRTIERNRLRRQQMVVNRRRLREENDPFTLPDKRFIELFRLDKHLTRNIIRELAPHLQQRTTRRGISVERRILTALRFYATGSYQRCVGEEYSCNLSQSSVHFIIREITQCIVMILAPQQILFPVTRAERNSIKQRFMEKFGFPGTVGAFDGTHIAIKRPNEEEHNFINRKGFHSINCQIMCDPDLRILNVFANFGESTHDSFIWNQSQIKIYMERLHEDGEMLWLVGDSGYPQSEILMTPFRDPPPGSPQARYNDAHMRARNTVERCIGLLKSRFRCTIEERTARYEPNIMCEIIKACAVLHNMCLDRGIPVEEVQNRSINYPNPHVYNHQEHGANVATGIRARERIMVNYFM